MTVKPSHDDIRLRLADTIIKRLANADADTGPDLRSAYRLLVGNDPELLEIAQARKRSGHPKGPRAADKLAGWVWIARHYRIPFSAIQDVLDRDPKWIVTRVKQASALIAAGTWTLPQFRSEYDALTPQERRQRILARLQALAGTVTE